MTDHFACLGEPRRPWLDEEALKAKFHALTAEHHPDVAGADAPDFSAINVAYGVLRDPRTRLRHLLELEAPGRLAGRQAVPPPIVELFTAMGDKKQSLDRFLEKRAAAGSALGRAMLASEQFRLQEEVEEWHGVLQAEKARWLDQIPALDDAWLAGPAERDGVAVRVAETAQALGYLEKWAAQLWDGLVKLQAD